MTATAPLDEPGAGRATGDDDLPALEEQRDFLLRSLDDLERERDAGDVDEHDYAALKDDYTARAAAALRAIERHRAGPVPQPPPRSSGRRWPRTAAWAAGVLAFAVLAGLLVAQSSGRRDPGGVATGDIRQTVAGRLNEAMSLMAQGDHAQAIERFDQVLADQPTNAEALTYRAWSLRLSGEREAGFTALLDAGTAAPDYPDVHALLAVTFFQEGLPELAAREIDLVDELDPPAHVRELIAPLSERVDAALAEQDGERGAGPPTDAQAGGGR